MATFVLIHGGHHGGWCWRDVAAELRKAGHIVHAPSLTGLGDRVHLLDGKVGHDTHARDIANLLFFEDLTDAILVGHSYAGVPITLAAELTDRIGHLVYLDAMVPSDGDSFYDLTPPVVRQHVEATRGQCDFAYPAMAAFLEVLPKWVSERLMPQPSNDLDRPVALPTRAAEKLRRTYLLATIGPNSTGPFGDWIAPWSETVKAAPWNLVPYAGDHEVMVTDSGLTARLLMDIAEN